jgi:RNase P subunit RPR2
MPHSESSLDFAANMIGGRPCAKCSSPMIIALTTPARLGYELRTFECVKCGRLEKVPVRTRSGQWHDSHLHEPK